MTDFVGMRIVRAPVPVHMNDLATLVAAVDDKRQITLTIIDGEMTVAWPFFVRQISSLHQCSHLHLPGGCKLDVRPIVLLHLLISEGTLGMDCFARYHAHTGRGTFISREVYEQRLRFVRTPGGVAPIVRTFLEQLLSEQPSHA